MNKMLSVKSKFRNVHKKPEKEINHMEQLEDRLISFLKCIKNSLSPNLYIVPYPKVSQPGVMYGLVWQKPIIIS